jgi:hypothetical protein
VTRVRVAAKAVSDAAHTAAKAHENAAAAAATSATAAAAIVEMLAMKLAGLIGPESPARPTFIDNMFMSMLNLIKLRSSQDAFEAALQGHPAAEVITVVQEAVATSWNAIAKGFYEIKLGEAALVASRIARTNITSFHQVLNDAELGPLWNALVPVNRSLNSQKAYRTSENEVVKALTRAEEEYSEFMTGYSKVYDVSTALAAAPQPELGLYAKSGTPLIDGVNFQAAISSLLKAATSAYDAALIHQKAELETADAANEIAREFFITATCYK